MIIINNPEIPPEISINELKLFLHKYEIIAITSNIKQVIIKFSFNYKYLKHLNKILINLKKNYINQIIITRK